eukprot:GHVT01003147.1.p1 GENE.GHVT01003147.1~~GHVT01003147.1.p1  ORF type:complete len:112 (+),score=29.55 GHVT01003147.1:751-1086(+)
MGNNDVSAGAAMAASLPAAIAAITARAASLAAAITARATAAILAVAASLARGAAITASAAMPAGSGWPARGMGKNGSFERAEESPTGYCRFQATTHEAGNLIMRPYTARGS